MDDDLTPHEPDPLEPAQLDELLSAELDGELATVARDLGASVEAVTARVNATPGADARRAALAAARDLLSTSPEINELLAQRLRAKAIRAAAEQHTARELDRRRRRRQVFVGAGGIAAAAVAVVTLAGGLGHSGSNTASEKSSENSDLLPADTTQSTAKSAPTTPPALGAFSDQRTLADAALVHLAAGAAANGSSSFAANRTQTGNRALAPTTTGAPKPAAASAPSRDAVSGSGALAIQKATTATLHAGTACPTPSGIATDDKLVLRATATLAGKPVIVFVFSGRGEHAIEIENTHCTLIDIEMR